MLAASVAEMAPLVAAVTIQAAAVLEMIVVCAMARADAFLSV